jgi:predicted kinase
MATVYLTVGPPGAGKTSFVSWSLVAAGKVSANYVLNPDGLLFDRHGYRWSEQRVTQAWQTIRVDYARMLAGGRDIVLDATSVKREERQPYVAAAVAAGHRVVAVWFDLPPALLVERDAARDDPTKRVGPEVIHRFVALLEPPTLAEGFDEVWTVAADGRVAERLTASPPERSHDRG